MDDHLLFAQALAEIICEQPELDIVGIAETGAQAIELARDRQPSVIVVDYHLPGITADELLPSIKKVAPRARTIVLTSDTSAAARERALRAGADEFMTKGAAIDSVVDSIRQLLTPLELPFAPLDDVLVKLPMVGSFARTATFVLRLERQPGVRAAWIHSMRGYDALVRVKKSGPHADIYAAVHGAAEGVKTRLQ